MGTRGVVSSGHYLATQIGLDMLKRGGNAMDAAAAVGLALNVLKPHQNGFGGEVPVLLYSASEKKIWALSGNGTAPQGATREAFQKLGLTMIPGDGQLPATVPSILSTWITLLERYGTLRLADGLAAPAGGVLFVIARVRPAGPPLAVVRLPAGPFPIDFEIGPGDVMIPGMPFAGDIQLTARIDADGDPLTRSPEDLNGGLDKAVRPGGAEVELTLHRGS